MKAPAVYILASQRNGTLYIGVTSDSDGALCLWPKPGMDKTA